MTDSGSVSKATEPTAPLRRPEADTTDATGVLPVVPPGPHRGAAVDPAVRRPGAAATAASRPVAGAAYPRPGVSRDRRQRVALRKVDPWSVFLTALMLSICLGIMTMVAAFLLYSALDKLGVPASVNKLVETLQGGQPVLTSGRFLGGAALLAGVNVVLLSILATLGALLYNLVSTLTGGIEVTLNDKG